MTNIHNQLHQYYENIEFTLTNGQSDYNLATNQATFLSNFGVGDTKPVAQNPTDISIRTNQTISVKLNKTTNHAITIASTDSPFRISGVEIYNIFLSNASGSDAAVKLLITSVPN